MRESIEKKIEYGMSAVFALINGHVAMLMDCYYIGLAVLAISIVFFSKCIYVKIEKPSTDPFGHPDNFYAPPND